MGRGYGTTDKSANGIRMNVDSRSLSFGRPSNLRNLGVLQLTLLTFYSVGGGPFGIEAAVSAAGPLYAIIGFLTFPLLWSIPEAMIVSEMSAMYPESSGFVAWTQEAFGHKTAMVEGYLSYFSGVTDNRWDHRTLRSCVAKVFFSHSTFFVNFQ